MATTETPAKATERDNTVRTRKLTPEELAGDKKVEVGKATEPMAAVEHKPTGEAKKRLQDQKRLRDKVAAHRAALTADDLTDKKREKIEKDIVDDTKRLAVAATWLRNVGYTLDTDEGDPVPPAPKTRAEAMAEAKARREAKEAEKAAKKATAKKSSRFPEDIRVAVKRARYELSALNPTVVAARKADPKAHVPGASAGQHITVRTKITELVGGPDKLTPAAVLKLTGYASYKALEDAAKWEGTKQDLEPLHNLAENFRPDSWAMGRYLAAIVTVFIWDLKEAAKVAKAAEKADAKKDAPKDDAPADAPAPESTPDA